jgi:hypothetical protein
MSAVLDLPTPATGARLRVVTTDACTDARWQDYVSRHPEALVYHLPAWLRVLHRTFGYRVIGLVCEDAAGEVRGVLPLVRKQGLITGRVVASLPHTPVAGPLASEPEAAAALVRAAVAGVRRARGTRLQIKPPPGVDVPDDRVTSVPWRLTYIRELDAAPAPLRFGNARNHARIKWAVSKAAREGVVIRTASGEHDLRSWYPLYLATMRERHVPPLPYRFFRVTWDELQPSGCLRLLLAERQSVGGMRAIAGSVFLAHNRTVFYAFNGRLREELSLRPNDALHWHMLHAAQAEGYRLYDFGEVSEENEGLAGFKSKWGSEPRQLERWYYPSPQEIHGGSGRSGPVLDIAHAVWERLPLPVTGFVGGLLYRCL